MTKTTPYNKNQEWIGNFVFLLGYKCVLSSKARGEQDGEIMVSTLYKKIHAWCFIH